MAAGLAAIQDGSRLYPVAISGSSFWPIPQHGISPLLGQQVTHVALGLDVKPFDQRPVVDVDPAVLESYAGSYSLYPKFVFTV
jgi:hypothetical protein